MAAHNQQLVLFLPILAPDLRTHGRPHRATLIRLGQRIRRNRRNRRLAEDHQVQRHAPKVAGVGAGTITGA